MAYKKVVVAGNPKYKEAKANAAITPGHLVERMSTGNVRVHATGGGSCQKMFAIEDSGRGKTIDDAYEAAQQAQLAICQPGDEIYALLYNGEHAYKHSLLESQGDGTLRVVDADASWGAIALNSIVGEALEEVDMSGSSGEDPSARILIEIW